MTNQRIQSHSGTRQGTGRHRVYGPTGKFHSRSRGPKQRQVDEQALHLRNHLRRPLQSPLLRSHAGDQQRCRDPRRQTCIRTLRARTQRQGQTLSRRQRPILRHGFQTRLSRPGTAIDILRRQRPLPKWIGRAPHSRLARSRTHHDCACETSMAQRHHFQPLAICDQTRQRKQSMCPDSKRQKFIAVVHGT